MAIYLLKVIDQCVESFLQWQICGVLKGFWGTVPYCFQKSTDNLFRYIGEDNCLTTEI